MKQNSEFIHCSEVGHAGCYTDVINSEIIYIGNQSYYVIKIKGDPHCWFLRTNE